MILVLQEGPAKANDLIDLLTEAAQLVVETEENGVKKKEIIPDNESLWMQTKMVNSPTFARYILKLRDFYDLAANAKDNMCEERAKVIADQILAKYKSHKYSIDSKSSETLRDAHNTQPSLNHLVVKQHTDRSITLKEEAGRSVGDMLMGREKQKAVQE